MKKIFRKEVIIGFSVLVALAVLIVGIDFLKGINLFHDANYYYATYTNVNGLSVSAPVTVNGYKVGLVKDIRYQYDNPGHVTVELSLDKELRIPKNTKAIISTDLLGTASVVLQMSSHPDYHNVGDMLIGENAVGLMDNISGAAGDIMPSVTSVVTKVDTMLTSLNAVVGDPALLASIKRLNSITGNLEDGTRTLNTSLNSLPPIMGDVKNVSGNLVVVGNNAVQMTGRINQILSELHKTYNDSRLDSTLYNIYVATENLKALSVQLNDPNSSLGKLMNDPALYNNINTVVNDLDSVLLDFKRQPKRYIPPIKIF